MTGTLAEPCRVGPALPDIDVPAVLLVLRWARRADAILAPAVGGGVSVAIAGDALPPDVGRALAQSWRAVRDALEAVIECTEAVREPNSPAVLTALAWTRAERAAWWLAAKAGDDRARGRLVAFEERAAIREYEAATPRWLAEARAVEELLSEPDDAAAASSDQHSHSGGDDGAT